MNIALNEDESHAEGIVHNFVYEAPSPPQKPFLPWHMPRKQFVRHYQWFDQIVKMLDECGCEGPFRYFGLPGIDLLDLRYFHSEICQPRGLTLKFLGLNSAVQAMNDSQIELNISLDEVRRLNGVDPQSDVISDEFVRVANDSSIAWKKASDFGPFDVINLDLCDGFGKGAPERLVDTHYSALTRLMSLQARTKNSWLLLLTTRAGEGHVHSDVLSKLLNTYISNLKSCDPFKDASKEHFSIEDEAALKASAATPKGLLPIYLCGLCKWLAGISLAQNPPTTIEVKSIVGYRIDEKSETEDLISLAIRFTPSLEPSIDPIGLAGAGLSIQSECEASVQALKRVARLRDVDKILREDNKISGEVTEMAASLMGLARYDVAAFRDWVSQS